MQDKINFYKNQELDVKNEVFLNYNEQNIQAEKIEFVNTKFNNCVK